MEIDWLEAYGTTKSDPEKYIFKILSSKYS